MSIMGISSEHLQDLLQPYKSYTRIPSGTTPPQYVLVTKGDGGLEPSETQAVSVFALTFFNRNTRNTNPTAIEAFATGVLDFLAQKLANSGNYANLDITSFGELEESASTTRVLQATIVIKTLYNPMGD